MIVDSNINLIHGESFYNELKAHGFVSSKIVFSAGESSKNLKIASNIFNALIADNFTKSDIIIGLGGGVTLNLAGYTASNYLNGIPYIQIPTSYLSAIDNTFSCQYVLNQAEFKNVIGANYMPEFVAIDYKFFETLSEDSLLEGSITALRYALLSDVNLIRHIYSHDFEYVVERCLSISKSLCTVDNQKTGLYHLLDFGNTVGHALESSEMFALSPGVALAYGLYFESLAAYKMNYTTTDISSYIKEILVTLGLNIDSRLPLNNLFSFTSIDKKIFNDTLLIIVPDSIGRCHIHKVPLSDFHAYIDSISIG